MEIKPDDLYQRIDTITARAEELLEEFPVDVVKYGPDEYGWK